VPAARATAGSSGSAGPAGSGPAGPAGSAGSSAAGSGSAGSGSAGPAGSSAAGSRRLRTAGGRLHPRAPFDFERSLAFLRRFPATEGEQSVEPNAVTKALRADGITVAFRVEGAGTVAEPELRYRVLSGTALSPALRRRVEARIASFLGVDDDLGPFYALAGEDPDLGPVVERLYGLHQVRFLTPFENACWAVLAQRIPMPMARRLKSTLVERFGGSILVEGTRYRAFPEPADLLGSAGSELSSLVRNERKARYLASVAEAFADVDEGWLRTGPYAEVESWLRAIDGVGAWSAAFVLFRGLGRGDRLPVTEPVVRAARRTYGPGLGAPDVRRIAEGYGRWQGYWALYLRVEGADGDAG
jgi:DNA-3-methyladenine glycosylase II